VAKAPSNSKRMSLYALRPNVVSDMSTAIADKYRDSPSKILDVSIGSVDGLLVSRMMSKKSETDWSALIRGLTGENDFTAKNEVAAAVLVIPSDGRAFAICYGMGHLLLDRSSQPLVFGSRYAPQIRIKSAG
jgi:uncharacterized protein (TIGR04141 family)